MGRKGKCLINMLMSWQILGSVVTAMQSSAVLVTHVPLLYCIFINYYIRS